MPSCARVVVIEREPAFRQALCAWLLSAEDATLTGVADNEAEGLLLVKERDADVVLLDTHLWRQAGAPRPIGRRYAGKRVLLLGNPEDEALVLEALGDGAAGYLARSAASCETTLQAILALQRGDVVLSPQLVGRIMDEIAGQLPAPLP
jgi:two-component system, NarL family, nitrate/nitrite response regulator NarL